MAGQKKQGITARKGRTKDEPTTSGTGTSFGASKSFKPLSTFKLGGSLAGSVSPIAKRQKTSNGKSPRVTKSNGSTSKPVSSEAIELSSDEDEIRIDDDSLSEEEEEKPTKYEKLTNEAAEDEDDVMIVGFKQATHIKSAKPPSSRSTDVSSRSMTRGDQKGDTSTSAHATSTSLTSKRLSSKAKGKQKAVQETTVVELEVTDNRTDALWAEKYAPVDFDSLCVHKKKVQDVQGWLEEAYAGGSVSKYRRVLILSGPAGSGKTATLRVLSKELGFEIVEYKTSEGDSESFSNQFPAFLNKATLATSLKFGTLTSDGNIVVPKAPEPPLDGKPHPAKANPTLQDFAKPSTSKLQPATASKAPVKRRLILVEDLPNIFTSPGTRAAFQSAIQSYAQSKRFNTTATQLNANVPLVIVVSEALTRPGQNEGENAMNRYQGSGEMSVSVRSVVPGDIFRAPTAAEFKFNPVAPTLMKKALNAILDREYSVMPAKKPSPRAVQLVIEASDGDIRSALNTLQFIVGQKTSSQDKAIEAEIEAQGKGKKGKKRKSSGKVKEDEGDESANRALQHLVATKESSLFLFHALGKVLFNKRWGENTDEDAKSTKPRPPKPEKLPRHLADWDRRATKVDINALFADAPVDSDLFMTYLHQNYPPFCDEVENCFSLVEYLSASDSILRMEGDSFSRHALTSHYSFQVSVRGALLSLPSPVQRRGQKMYKSEVWDVMKRRAENADHIGYWTKNLNKETADGAEDVTDLLPRRSTVQLELLPFIGLMQAPNRSFSAASTSSMPGSASMSASQNIFKSPHPPTNPSSASASTSLKGMQGPYKLNKNLLDIAFMPPPPSAAQPAMTGPRAALNEKDVPDEEDEDEEDRKPSAPAVKVEEGYEEENDESTGPAAAVEKLYLSDDDIADF